MTEYNDGLIANKMIEFLSWKISRQLDEYRPPAYGTYDGFVDLSREVMKGRGTAGQRAVIDDVLMSVMPGFLLATFRALYPPVRLAAEWNAFITTLGFRFLVGEMEREWVELQRPNGEVVTWQSGVRIKKCRYLEQSGCVGMCVNMCKVPTEKFFNDAFGQPLHMQPDFEDLSCLMVFGQKPPPLEEDEALEQGCFSQCKVANMRLLGEEPCHRIDVEE